MWLICAPKLLIILFTASWVALLFPNDVKIFDHTHFSLKNYTHFCINNAAGNSTVSVKTSHVSSTDLASTSASSLDCSLVVISGDMPWISIYPMIIPKVLKSPYYSEYYANIFATSLVIVHIHPLPTPSIVMTYIFTLSELMYIITVVLEIFEARLEYPTLYC